MVLVIRWVSLNEDVKPCFMAESRINKRIARVECGLLGVVHALQSETADLLMASFTVHYIPTQCNHAVNAVYTFNVWSKTSFPIRNCK